MKPIVPLSKEKLLIKETLEIIKNGFYVSPQGNIVELENEFKLAKESSVYHPNPISSPYGYETIEVSNVTVTFETTAEAGQRFLQEGKDNVVVLNFASAICPGGGFLGAAKAQEEDLCRASGLYPCLKNKPKFYNANIVLDSYLYTHGMIYSPNVPFFRNNEMELLEEPFYLSVITAPAPCLMNVSPEILEKDARFIESVIDRRIEAILELAATYGHKNVVLGAFGCGAFRNDPVQMASLFKKNLSNLKVFDNVCFAIYDKSQGTPLLSTFKEILLER